MHNDEIMLDKLLAREENYHPLIREGKTKLKRALWVSPQQSDDLNYSLESRSTY